MRGVPPTCYPKKGSAVDQAKLIEDLQWEALAYAIVAGTALLTLLGLVLTARPRRWLPIPRLRPGDLNGRDVFFAFCIMIGFPTVIVDTLLWIGFFTPTLGPPPASDDPAPERVSYALQCIIVSSPLALTIILGLVMGIMYA